MDRNEAKTRMAMMAAGGFLCGSSVLIVCTFIQKFITGFDPFQFNGYIVPLFYGGIAGGLLCMKSLQVRMLNKVLATRNNDLGGIVPICSYCKAVREPGKDPRDKTSWSSVEDFLYQNTTSRLTHSICPDCVQEIYPEIYQAKYSGSDPNT